MNYLRLVLALLPLGAFTAIHAEPVCPKCELIRQYNKEHPENNYYWYDDYLKEHKEEGAPEKPNTQNNKAPSTP